MIDFIYPLGLRIRAEKKMENFYLPYVWEDASMASENVLSPL